MFRKVLLVNSGTLDADGAWEASLALASRFHAELHMVLAEELPRFPISIAEVDHERKALRQRTTYIVSSASTRAAEANVAFEAHYGRPSEQLSRAVACPVVMINR